MFCSSMYVLHQSIRYLFILFVRSEHVPDIVTSADVKQLNNIGDPLPGDQPAPPDVGGHDHNVGNSHTSNTGVNQPVQGMPNIDHHAFVSQHSVPGK